MAWEILDRLWPPNTMIEFVGDRPEHDFRYSLDCMIHCLAWRREVSFEVVIQKTIDWHTANQMALAPTTRLSGG